MNDEIKQQWVAALRSGEFRQATGQLKTEVGDGTNSYCCLGVLCELHRRATEAGYWRGREYQPATGTGSIYALPPAVWKWAGLPPPLDASLPSEACLNPVVGSQFSLAVLNDGSTFVKQRDFNEIAKLIEENL